GNLVGIEIQEKRSLQAIANIKLNHLEHRISMINNDLKDLKLDRKADIIVSNPPFFKVHLKTKRSIDLDMEIAKHEIYLTLDQLIYSVKNNIKYGGLFFLVHKADRLDEIFKHLEAFDFF